ncbi:MAG: 3-methyl-2-oxobutanoate hydroxymethyltransferase, partial [Acidiferrobacteraceae bacterium]
VLEVIPAALAAEITGAAMRMATIGIGAGSSCDGQVLVLHDLLGISDRFRPRFAKDFVAEAGSIPGGIAAYAEAVRSGRFPGPEHGF